MKNRGMLFLLLVLSMSVLTGCFFGDEDNPSERKLEQDGEIIDEYLTENGIAFETDDSGIRYIIHHQGNDVAAADSSYVSFIYEARLFNIPDQIADEGYLDIQLSNLIQGFSYGIPQIGEGGTITMYIPSSLGYKNKQVGPFPANSILVFDVELLRVRGTQLTPYNEETRLQIDTDIIAGYLADRGIVAEKDESGLQYVIHEQGTGAFPDSLITIAYEAQVMRLLLTTTAVDDNDGIQFVLDELIEGFQIGLPLIQEGGRITLYIPSVLAYKNTGFTQAIHPHANLIFDIELLAAD